MENNMLSAIGGGKTSDEVKTQILAALNWLKERTSESAALQAYPIGSIYMSTNATSPQTLFGGTWQALDQGRVLIGANASHPAGSTGGAETHVITTQEMPSHNHSGSTNSTGDHSHTRGSMNITGSLLSQGSHVQGTNGAFYETGANGWRGDNIHTMSNAGIGFDASRNWSGSTSSTGSHSHTVTINSTGGGSAMSLMQPYLAVYMWERTA